MRTRCSACNTVFRVTPEQLRLKGGKVRCGQCQAVFNAYETLIDDTLPPAVIPEPLAARGTTPELASAAPVEAPPAPWSATPPVEDFTLPPAAAEIDNPPLTPAETVEIEPWQDEPTSTPEPAFVAPPEDAVDVGEVVTKEEPTPLPESSAAPPENAPEPEETVEESTRAARDAGLVAARELTDTPGFNRWAAGTLAGTGGGLQLDEQQPSRIPFLVAAIMLGLVLVCQMAYYWRTSVVQRLPETAGIYQSLGVDVPLPRISDLVAIESSDLQFDKARGLFVLQATLHNRATFAQEWPALELTLTDTSDTVVTRRVLGPADYLPPNTDLSRFAGRAELAIRLWLEAREIGAAGYRLYIFYP